MRALRIVGVVLAGLLLFAVAGWGGHVLVSAWYLLAAVPVYFAVCAATKRLEKASRSLGGGYAPRVTGFLAAVGCVLVYISMAVYDWNVSYGTADVLCQLLGFSGGSAVGLAIMAVAFPLLFEPS